MRKRAGISSFVPTLEESQELSPFAQLTIDQQEPACSSTTMLLSHPPMSDCCVPSVDLRDVIFRYVPDLQ